MGRLILVSNRLPVQIRRTGRRHLVLPSAGGLVSGLGPVHEAGNGLWIGTLGAKPNEAVQQQLAERRQIAVVLPKEAAARHYEGYSNGMLWPLFHYLIGSVTFDRKDWDAYYEVNERFADAVEEHYRPGDSIWVHDYHLMLLPRMLRERLPEASIAFFLHIPFPSSEVFRILPRKEAILRGLLGSNLVGLHTYDYARHLVSSFRRLLGVEFDDDWTSAGGERCHVGVFPLGVDFDVLQERATQPSVERRCERLRKQALGRKIILGVDRMDYTKGLPLRLQAYRRFLELYPKWRDQAVLWQLVVPSRSNIPQYRALKEQVERAVGEINGMFSQGGSVPIQYMYRSVPADELAALYRAADVGLVTPVRDGMNLVAKEYVASRPDNTGVLVLSEFAGAASEMGEALMHNPWDVDGTAEAIKRALEMERDESARRMAALRKRANANNVHRWVKRFLAAFEASCRPLYAPTDEELVAAHEWRRDCLAAFARCKRAVMALDYDGTLIDIAQTPEQAEPTPPLRALLALLGRHPKLELVVLSGRDMATIQRWLGDLPVHLVAEHGFWYRPRGSDRWQEVVRNIDLSWKAPVREVMEDYAARAPGVIIEDKKSTLSWHYRLVEPAFGGWLARELAQHLVEAFAQNPVAVHLGKKVVEVRPYGIDKGRAYKVIEQRLGPFDFVLAAGDDHTDEDLFAALSAGAWAIRIGAGQSRAAYRLGSPKELREFLEALSKSALLPAQSTRHGASSELS